MREKAIFSYSIVFVFLSIFSLIFLGCGGGGDGGSGGGTTTSIQTGAVFTEGSNVIVTTETVGSSGGTLTIADTGTFLDGIQITFPAGALSEDTEITIGYNDGTVTLPEGVTTEAPLQTLAIHSNGATNFLQAVEITVPYTSNDEIPIPFYIDNAGYLNAVLVKSIDTENMTITYVTSHASLWTFLENLNYESTTEDTSFRAGNDGFKIANHGSLINVGECLGMTAFTQWYFDSHMETDGDFYDSFLTNVGMDAAGNALTGQDVIATRAHSAINQAWLFNRFVDPVINTDDEYRYTYIVAALQVTKRPVVLFIRGVNESGEDIAHAVLAYAVNGTTGTISIYDPNYPNVAKQISYDSVAQEFNDYVIGYTYNWFTVFGMGTYDLNESFANILEDAEHNFTSNNMPAITITSHENGAIITDRKIALSGTIESSEVLIKQLEIYLNDDKFSVGVANDGTFSANISLNGGEQVFRFITKDEDGNVVSPNNTDTEPFSLIVDLFDDFFVTNTNEIAVPEGTVALFYVTLSEKPESPIIATVTVSSGDPDIKIVSDPSLQFDATNWDIDHAVALYAEPDDDMINGSARILISTTGTSGIGAAFVTANENEVNETSLYIQYEFRNQYCLESFSGTVPVTIITREDRLEVVPIHEVDAIILEQAYVNCPLWCSGSSGHVAATLVDNYTDPIWYDPVDIFLDNTSVTPYYLSDYPGSLAIQFEFRYFIRCQNGEYYTESLDPNFLLSPPEFLYDREYSREGSGRGYWRVQLLQP